MEILIQQIYDIELDRQGSPEFPNVKTGLHYSNTDKFLILTGNVHSSYHRCLAIGAGVCLVKKMGGKKGLRGLISEIEVKLEDN